MIVVTAPTGTIGHQVLEGLLDSGEPIRVIARDPSRLPSQTRERVEVVQGSHGDIDVVSHAFTGADAVFWLVPPDPRAKSVEAAYLDFTRPACDALKSQGVRPLKMLRCGCGGPSFSAARHSPLRRPFGSALTASISVIDQFANEHVMGDV
jgi:nucleoside-diphosphate-sugar epimerase